MLDWFDTHSEHAKEKDGAMQITPAEIAETLAMVSKQHLDIRTITLGLNLRGCTDSDIDVMARKV